MKSDALIVFIVDEDRYRAYALRKYLRKKFGSRVNTSLFFGERSFLSPFNEFPHVIIINLYSDSTPLSGSNKREEFMEATRLRYPGAKLVLLTSHDQIGSLLGQMNGNADFVVDDFRGWTRIRKILERMFFSPFRMFVEEYGIFRFLVIFFLAFTLLGIIAVMALRTYS